MESESKHPSSIRRTASVYEVDRVRNDLLRCPGLNATSEAMQVALKALDEVEEVIKVKIQLEMKRSGTLKQGNEYKASFLTEFEPSYCYNHDQLQKQPIRPEQINIQNNNYASNSDEQESNTKEKKLCSNSPKSSSLVLKILRTITIDLPLLSLFILTCMTYSLSHVYEAYLGPQMKYMKYTDANRTHDLSYYHRVCPLGKMSTTELDDLLIGDDFTTDECVEHMMVHGMSIYKDLINPNTAKQLRAYIINKNKNLKSKDAIGVIENENRWSFGIGANDHPSVAQALNEIATNEVLRPALEKIAGRNPAMIEMTAITAAYGATDQFWHPDIISAGSPTKYVRNFVPSYALFITLQDTTAAMGATGVCPGTYMCGNEDATDTCAGKGFQVANDNNIWKTGDGLLMNQQSFHRGSAHEDPKAPHRVVFIVTFAPRPKVRGETRMLGQGGSYSLRWDMWGHTLNDLENAPTAMIQPWTTLRALGLYKPKNSDWGWDFITQHSMRAATEGTGYESEDEFIDMITIPKALLPKMKNAKPFEDYFMNCVTKWKTWARTINGIALAIYLVFFVLISLIGLAFNKTFSKHVMKGIIWETMRMFILYFLTASSTYYLLMHRIPSTAWGISIRNGKLFYPPFTVDKSLQLEVFTERGPFVIDENDILISDRFNDKSLNSLSDILTYHPGNMELNANIKGAVATFSFLSKSGQNDISKTIVNDAFNRSSNFALHNDNAIWVPLTGTEATKYVLNQLNMEARPLLQCLSREAFFFLSEYRYGYMKSTVMSRQWGYAYMTQLMEMIYAEFDVPLMNLHRFKRNSSFGKVSFLPHKTKSLSLLKSLLIRPTFSRTNGPSAQVRSPNLYASRKQRDPVITILKEGDVVEGQYNNIYDEWYKGRIFEIAQGSKVKVQYLDGEIDDLDSTSIKPFKPYSAGEIIEATFDDNEEFNKVEVIKSLGNQIVVKSNKHRHNEPFTVSERDVRRFYS